MKRDSRAPQTGMIVALCVALGVLWLVALYGTYEESKREKYDVRVSPGAVTYGTHSTATIPMTSVSTHHSAVPMISGGAIRHYAHYGHATMPSATSGSGYRLHTTSSATVHTLGSGGGGGGVGGASSSSSSSRGINYSGGSVSMPTLALATPTYATGRTTTSLMAPQTQEVTAAPGRVGHVRKAVVDDSDGEAGERRADNTDPTLWWYWDEDLGWVTESDMSVGTKWNNNGTWYTWNGSSWVADSGGDVGDPTNTPIGDAPWHWMLLLMAVYGGAKVWKRNKTKNLI